MVNNNSNKVLTVSYGTFSCTLEGFEDSFGVMKEVAEYFRDLAEQDRFFGAEPPKLDAEMLTVLAKRSKQLGIAARTEGTNVVLTPAHEPQTPVGPITRDAQTDASTIESRFETSDTTQDEADAKLTLEERLQKIRSVVNARSTATALHDAITDTSDDEPMDQEVADDATAVAPVETGSLAEPELRDDAAQDPVAPDAVAPTVAVAPEAVVQDAPVDTHDEATQIDADATPDEDAPLDELVDTIVLRPSHTEDENADLANTEELTADDAPVAAQDAVEADLDDAEHTPITETADVVADAEVPVEQEQDTISESDAADLTDENETDDLDAILNAITEEDAPLVLSDAIETSDNDADAPRKGRVHVIDLRKTDVSDASEDEDDFESLLTQTLQETEAQSARAEPPVDADADDNDDAAADVNATPVRPTRPSGDATARPRRDASLDTPQNDMSRLIEQTNKQLAEPDNSRRRNALAHLRAAVAATMADKSLVKSKSNEAADAYRDDLAQVVRPTRPTKPNAENPMPLRLVAEQRIDVAPKAEEPQAPAQAHAKTTQTETFESFAAYADHVGAHSLPEKLEAAAAYLTQVKGIESFSRPQVMRTVMASEGENFERDESLRNFARMIKDGKIVRNEQGMWGITENLGYRLEDRKTG